MRRRELIAIVGAASTSCVLTARAQQPAIPMIGYLAGGLSSEHAPGLAAFRDGLEQSGHVEGRNVAIETRIAETRFERLPGLAAELIAHKVVVIAAIGTPAAVAARQATRTIPIAFYSTDPVAFGLVESFSRPGGNATGVSMYVGELAAKRLELLLDLLPNARSVAVLANPAGPRAAAQLDELRAGAPGLGLDLLVAEARTEIEIEQAFASLAERRPGAVLVASDPFYVSQRRHIVALAARHAIPAIFDYREAAIVGGLISYGPSSREGIRTVGLYVGRILKGARPADLPVQQPTRFELVINLKTARVLGLTISSAMLARADEVIE